MKPSDQVTQRLGEIDRELAQLRGALDRAPAREKLAIAQRMKQLADERDRGAELLHRIEGGPAR